MSKIHIYTFAELADFDGYDNEQDTVVPLSLLREAMTAINDLVDYAELSTLENDPEATCVTAAKTLLGTTPDVLSLQPVTAPCQHRWARSPLPDPMHAGAWVLQCSRCHATEDEKF